MIDMIKKIIELTKVRISFLVLITTVLGFYLGSRGSMNIELLFYTLLGSWFSSMGSSVFNNVLEIEFDRLMKRTRNRVLPSNQFSKSFAIILGFILCFSGLIILLYKVNFLTFLLSLITILSYLLIYTPLKRVSWTNTMIGAIPGALPPAGGWVAATNSLDWGALALFLILFFWQHPHFYSLAYIYRKDYESGGFKMLSSTENGIKRTVRHIFIHALLLIPISTLPFFLGFSGRFYLVGAYLLSNIYMLTCLPFIIDQSNENARLIFRTSIYYFPLLLILIFADLRV